LQRCETAAGPQQGSGEVILALDLDAGANAVASRQDPNTIRINYTLQIEPLSIAQGWRLSSQRTRTRGQLIIAGGVPC
jgi:hypothetical protein